MNPFTRSPFFALVVALSIPAYSQTIRQFVFTTETPTSCTAPTPSSSFAISAPQIFAWFLIDGVFVGDVFRLEWTAADGVPFTSFVWEPSPAGGSRCYWVSITPATANLPPSKAGLWNVALSRNGGRLYTSSFQLGTQSARPVINTVFNAASGLPNIAPNTWISIKGTNLARTTRTWGEADFRAGPMPTVLDGVGVTFNGKDGYVSYISPTQVNVLTPPDLLLGTAQVAVTSNGSTSPDFTATSLKYSPSLFTFNGYSVAGINADGTLLPGVAGVAWRRPKANDTIVIFGNGFGETSQQITSGSPTQSGSLLATPAISIAGTPAIVEFAGLVSPGLYQFNVVVPSKAAQSFYGNSYPELFHSITATYQAQSSQDNVQLSVEGTVREDTLTAFQLASPSITGGESTTAQVTLSQLDAAGRAVEVFLRVPGTITVSTSNGTILTSTPFAGDTIYLMAIPAGHTILNLTLGTNPVTTTQTLTLSASMGSRMLSAPLTIRSAQTQTSTFRDYDLRILGTIRLNGQDLNTQITASPVIQPTGKVEAAGNTSSRVHQLSVTFFDMPPTFTATSVTFSGALGGVYVDSNDAGKTGSVTSGRLVLNATSPNIGTAVTGTLQFATLGGTLSTTFSGTITASSRIR